MTTKAIIYTSRLLHFIRHQKNFSFCFEPWVELRQGDQRSRAQCLSGLKSWDRSLVLVRDAAALDRHFEAMWTPHTNFGGKTNLNH
jgi:hypothetical protein